MFGLFGTGKGKKESTPQSRKAEHDELILKISQYVCAISPGKPMKVLALGGSMETKSTSGEAGLQYQIKTDSGFGNLFIFPRFASIWMLNEPEPRHPLPMQMIEDDLKAMAGPADKRFHHLFLNKDEVANRAGLFGFDAWLARVDDDRHAAALAILATVSANAPNPRTRPAASSPDDVAIPSWKVAMAGDRPATT